MQPESAASEGSVVRTLLLTDLVDSTRLIERLGDRRAARLLAEEEAAARRLAQRYDGQEIDRSDGFLFIFEHAWQAVGFALDYHRALAELSADLPLQLQGRVGIHVGETYLTPNAAEDVARGAKQVEVSGLAKPIAARLMSAAHPGQTLVSGTVYDLAQRPCADRLPAEPALHWVRHGSWLLKGVAEPVQVVAVAHAARAAAREPRENDKVRSLRRRQRRRWLLGAAAAGSAAIAPAGWWLWRRNRMAHWQSEWLVIADWDVAADDAALGPVLGTAFRIALQQSRFAFVMDPSAVLAALQRMRKEPPVRRAQALEIARRESAVAAIVPSFAAFAGGILLGAEVVAADSERTIGAAQEQVADLGQLTQALDRLAASIRGVFGEPDIDVQRNALPLAKVTTGNFEALRLFSDSERAMGARRDDEAVALLERAIVLDPEFASAHAKLGTLHLIRRADPGTSEKHWRRAAQLTERLSEREKMYVEGCLSWSQPPVAMRARWSAMASSFPDDAAAVNNAAVVEWTQFGDMAAAERSLRSGLDIPHPWNYTIWHHLGYVLLGQGRIAESRASFEESLKRAEHPTHFGMLRVLLLADDLTAAEQLLQRFRGSGAASWQLDQAEADVLLLAWRGELARALSMAEGQREQAFSQRFRSAERIGLRMRMLLGEALGDEAGARKAAAGLRRVIAPELHESSGNVFVLPQSELLQLWMLAARKGWDDLVEDPDTLLVGNWSEFPVLQAQAAMVRGWQALRAGRPDDALRLVLKARDQAPLFATFELEAAAYAELGQDAERRERVRQAKARLGQGLSENYNHFSTHLPNLLAWQRMSADDTGRESPS